MTRPALAACCLIALAACARATRTDEEPLPVAGGSDRAAALYCVHNAASLTASTTDGYRRVLAAMRALRIQPLVRDSAGNRIVVAGSLAPAARGSDGLRRSRLYLEFRFVPDSSDPSRSAMGVTQGVSIQPGDLSADERMQLHHQASDLADLVSRRAGFRPAGCWPDSTASRQAR